MVRDKKKTSPYSKMYLVTPMVYEKLKTCLNKVDQVDLTNLNKKYQSPPQDKSNIGIQNLSKKEFKRDDDDDNDKKPNANKNITRNTELNSDFIPEPTVNRETTQYDDNQFQNNFDLSQHYIDDLGESEMYFDDEDFGLESNEIPGVSNRQEFQQQTEPMDSSVPINTKDVFTQVDSLNENYPIVKANKNISTQTTFRNDYEDTSKSNTVKRFRKPLKMQKRKTQKFIPISYMKDYISDNKPKITTVSTGIQTDNQDKFSFEVPRTSNFERTIQPPPLDMDMEMIYRKPKELLDKRKFPALQSQRKKALLDKRKFPALETNEKKSIPYDIKKSITFKPNPALDERRNISKLQFRERFLPHLGKKGFLKYQCDVCKKWFAQKYSVNRHKRTFHRNLNKTVSRIPVSDYGRNITDIVEYTPNNNYSIEHSSNIPITHEPNSDSDTNALEYENFAMPLTYEPDKDNTIQNTSMEGIDTSHLLHTKRRQSRPLISAEKIQRARTPVSKREKAEEKKKITDFERWNLE